ncbi:ribokinase [Undibacterium sp. TJN25]|uniref:ribokinase n=1 Tax=Undibacterium sp. TJN25 TaxID=3413056 RepID=UPI003BF327F5
MKPRIAVVGSVNMDLVFRTPRMPAVGETLSGHEFRQIPGGKGANQAVAAARQGADVAFIGRVGDDGFGQYSIRCLSEDGIDVSYLSAVPDIATGVAGIIVTDAGDNSIVLAAGANAALSAENVDAAQTAISSAQLLVCQLETPLSTVTRAIQLAKQHNVKVILNPAPVQALADELLQQVDYLVINETEASQLSGIPVTSQESAHLASEKLLQRGVSAVLLTMGEQGLCITEPGKRQYIAAIRVDAVDTTAAGDTFVGAFAVGIGRGLDIHAASVEAQYAAALTVTKLGAQTSIPSRSEVEEFMQSRAAG